MGCVSSKVARKDLKREFPFRNGDHVVSLTSSTYGVLQLDKEQPPPPPPCIKKCVLEVKKSSPPREDPAEVINTWELMEDLDETEFPCFVQPKKSPKSGGFLDYRRSPLKLFNQKGSPKTVKRFRGGKENSGKAESSPKTFLKVYKRNDGVSNKGSPDMVKCDSLVAESGQVSRSLRPLFDPELLKESEQRKKTNSPLRPISRKPWNTSKDADKILQRFPKICPPGGENSVVIYTTTLRGIRKTFEDCNIARSILQLHEIRTFERDISMHSGFKEELRALMGTTEVKVPLVFVRGRLIGGADEISKLDEEGTLGILLAGIPRAGAHCCGGCGGVRFLLCWECSGRSKVLGEDGKISVKCGECNENGLIQCPICC